MTRNLALAHIKRGDDGIARGEWGPFSLESAFQPVFSFGTGGALTITAFEGLIRPFRGGEPVSPGLFFQGIPAHERFTIETLTRTLHLLNAGAFFDPKTSLFVNFSPKQFVERSLAENALRDMRLVLHEAGVDPSRIVCEMTEQVSASTPSLYGFVDSLRGEGFRIAVDDYGSDNSDIRRVEQLRPDMVKFDAQWITELMETGAGLALLKTMVSTFEAQGARTVFEGIEESWQLDLAEETGASMVQGYALARPQLAPTEWRYDAEQAAIAAAAEVQHNTPRATFAGPEDPAAQNAPLSALRYARPKTFGRRQVQP